MKKYSKFLGILGLFVFLYGLIIAIFYSNIYWYTPFVMGGMFLLGYINLKLGNESFLTKLEKNKIYLLKTYGIYLVFTILIEFFGNFLLNLWDYPFFGLVENIIYVLIIGYPAGFFFIGETLILIKSKINSLTLSIIFAILINAFVHEVPNIFVWTWIYTIPIISFEILKINIVVIVGWTILIIIPLVVKKFLNTKK